MNRPEYILSNDVHELQSGTHKKDDVFDISRGEPATLKSEHLFHFMFLKSTVINMRFIYNMNTDISYVKYRVHPPRAWYITEQQKVRTFSREY